MDSPRAIGSVTEFLERIRLLTRESTHGYFTLFRGQEDTSWPLLPGIARSPAFGDADICTDPDNSSDRSKERRILIVFRDHAPSYLPQWVWTGSKEYVRWKQITVAQHYRLPTRLLDWTANPLVALFFAIEKATSLADPGIAYFVGRETTSVESLARRNEKPPIYEGRIDGQQGELSFVRPPDIDHRITAQSSFFSVSATPRVPLCPDGVVLVKAVAREEIRTELSIMGINRKNLFPGLEGLADHLKWDHTRWR
jgi:hypothetical protein